MHRAYFWEILIDASNRLGPGGQNFSKVSASLIVYSKLGSEQTFMNFQVISFHSARTGSAKKSFGIKFSKVICMLIVHSKLSSDLTFENVYISTQRESALRRNHNAEILENQLYSDYTYQIEYRAEYWECLHLFTARTGAAMESF